MPPRFRRALLGTAPLGAVLLSAPGSAGAVYPVSFGVNVTTDAPGTASGSVDSNPAGIDCPGTMQHDFTAVLSADIVAHLATGTRFDHWSGAPCESSADATCTVSGVDSADLTAHFVPTRALTVNVAGPGSVTGDGIACPTPARTPSTSGGAPLVLRAVASRGRSRLISAPLVL